MDLSIGNIGAFLLILFCINSVMVGIGLADESQSTKMSVINSTPETIYSDYDSGDLNVSTGEMTTPSSEATTDPSLIEGVPYKEDSFSRSQKLWTLLKGLTIGWSAIIFALGLPTIINFILIGAIGIIEFLAILYVLLYVFSILRGGGGI
jgi:hypothetical protein